VHEILVISLPRAGARRRLIQAQLDFPGMPPYRFLDAVEGAALDSVQLARLYDENKALSIQGALTLPEIGCAASHLAAFRQVVDRALPLAVVLEDDALLGVKFVDALEAVRTAMNPAVPQAVLLSHVVRYSAWGARRLDKIHRLCKPYEAFGGHGYVITLAGAQAMLDALPRVCTVGDDWHYFASMRILSVSAVVPYVVGTSPFSTLSDIGDERRKRVAGSPMQRWIRKYLWQKLLFQLVVKPALRLHRAEQTW
jgi:glycosyl transferase family 25